MIDIIVSSIQKPKFQNRDDQHYAKLALYLALQKIYLLQKEVAIRRYNLLFFHANV